MPDRPWGRSPGDAETDTDDGIDTDDPVTFSDWLRSVRRRYDRLLSRLGPVVVLVVVLATVAVAVWYVSTTYVLGIGCIQPGSPATAFEHEFRDSTLTIRHDGGDAYTSGLVDRVEVRVDGRLVASPLLPFEAGDRVTVHDVPRGSRVRIVAVLSDEYADRACRSKRQQVATFTVPS